MLSHSNLNRTFSLLACLPYDACDSVTALYECLVFLSEEVAPLVTWKVHYLATAFLVPHFLAQAYHTHAVSLMLSNYRRLVLFKRPPNSLAPVEEKDSVSILPPVNEQFPPHLFELQRTHLKKSQIWLAVLSSPDL